MARVHTKYWHKEAFGNNLEVFKNRSIIIENLGGELQSIKKHKFQIQENLVKLETEFVEKKIGPFGKQSIKYLNKLAKDLSEINRYIPHGDIVKRNIIWDGEKYILVDWEPLLEYGIQPNIFFKSTKPYIFSADIELFKITINTDKIAFFYFCRKIIHGWFSTDKKELAILEKKITVKNFYELVDFAKASPIP